MGKYLGKFYSSCGAFLIFTIIILVKCLLFHYACFHYIAISSLWNDPHSFFVFYIAKLFPAVFISSFIFLTNKKWWTIIVSVLIDMWLVSNLIYYRANDLFLDAETIAIADNLSGFGDSILMYLNWQVFAIVLVGGGLLFVVKDKSQRCVKKFALALGLSFVLFFYDLLWGFSSFKTTNIGANDGWKYNAFETAKLVSSGNYFQFKCVFPQWVEAQTPLHFMFAYPYYEVRYKIIQKGSEFEVSETDEKNISEYIDSISININVTQNLILILGESFESWAFDVSDLQGNEVMPNINKFIKGMHISMFPKIRSEALRGGSGDGQMIVNTGLLPISSGAACMLFGNNVFPNLANHWENSVIVNPCHNVWNQTIVTESYGYKYLIEDLNEGWGNDLGIIKKTIDIVDTIIQPFCIMPITVSTHSPFKCDGMSNMLFPKEMPENCRNYLNCMHYADSCIGVLLDKLEQDSLLDNTTVVITGDHTIFKSSLLRDFQPFAQKYHYPIPEEESFCPLIIYSPNIAERVVVDEECYQMDIFPTILHCIGAEGYYWKGFGVNLLDSVARKNRPITENEAYILSDKMIRSNYFKQIQQNIEN